MFTDNNLDGDFEPITPFIPLQNIEYELNIFFNNEMYKASTSKIITSGFSEVFQGDSTLFSGEEIEVNVSIMDDITTDKTFIKYVKSSFLSG